MATLLRLVNWPDFEARAKDVVAFETQVAQASWTKAQQRDLLANYNPMSIDEIRKLAPGFNWTGFLANAKMAKLRIIVVQEKSAFPKLAEIYAKAPIETIRAWHAFHIADNAAPYLSNAFTEAYFQLHNNVLAGQQLQQVLEARDHGCEWWRFWCGRALRHIRNDGLRRWTAVFREIISARR